VLLERAKAKVSVRARSRSSQRSRLKSQVVIDAEILVSPQGELISGYKPAIECVLDSALKDFAGGGA
jgi:hypothetical protein